MSGFTSGGRDLIFDISNLTLDQQAQIALAAILEKLEKISGDAAGAATHAAYINEGSAATIKAQVDILVAKQTRLDETIKVARAVKDENIAERAKLDGEWVKYKEERELWAFTIKPHQTILDEARIKATLEEALEVQRANRTLESELNEKTVAFEHDRLICEQAISNRQEMLILREEAVDALHAQLSSELKAATAKSARLTKKLILLEETA